MLYYKNIQSSIFNIFVSVVLKIKFACLISGVFLSTSAFQGTAFQNSDIFSSVLVLIKIKKCMEHAQSHTQLLYLG